VPFELLIPFLVLFGLVIYLIYSRGKFENKILAIYEDKFQEWKKHNSSSNEVIKSKELIGLVFRQEHKIVIELFDEKNDIRVESRLKEAKFDLKVIGKSSE